MKYYKNIILIQILYTGDKKNPPRFLRFSKGLYNITGRVISRVLYDINTKIKGKSTNLIHKEDIESIASVFPIPGDGYV